jgi:LPXTG-motif cell wall-anchored protein/uncharacterized repeat protein (TIGR01451 family)
MGIAALNSPVQAAPGNPGVPSAPTTVFHEDFENVSGADDAAQIITDYTSAGGTTYTASPSWLDTANCNGVVANALTTAPLSCSLGTYTGFGATLMQAMGIENQTTNPATNYGLLEITSGTNDGNDTIQLETENGITTSESLSGRFVTFGITAAATTCNQAQPVLTFSLINDGTELPTGNSGVNACTDPRGHASTVTTPGGGAIRVGSYFSTGSTLVGDAGDLGFIVRNVTASGSGNDLAFDDITIVDATPQLDKEFVDADAGVLTTRPTTLRFTVTNTSDLAEKDGWEFSDALPDGLVLSDAPNAATTCAAGDITAAAGDDSISIENGNIAAGVSSCTVTVDVVAQRAGTFSNGPSNVTTTGLKPPGTSEITADLYAPSLRIAKSADLDDANHNGVADAGETILYSFDVTNTGNVPIFDIEVNDDKVSGLDPASFELSSGDSQVVTADLYVVTAADARSRDGILNVATATGHDRAGDPVISDEDSVTTATAAAPDAGDDGDDGDGNGVLPDTGGSSLPLLLAGAGVAAAGAVLVGRKRRANGSHAA